MNRRIKPPFSYIFMNKFSFYSHDLHALPLLTALTSLSKVLGRVNEIKGDLNEKLSGRAISYQSSRNDEEHEQRRAAGSDGAGRI
jgi:hypothetical protein